MKTFEVKKFRWVIPRGSDFSRASRIFVPAIKDENGEIITPETPVSLVGATIYFLLGTLAFGYSHGDPAIDEIVITNAAQGRFTLNLSSLQTNINAGEYDTEVWIQLQSGGMQRWAKGLALIDQSLVQP